MLNLFKGTDKERKIKLPKNYQQCKEGRNKITEGIKGSDNERIDKNTEKNIDTDKEGIDKNIERNNGSDKERNIYKYRKNY